MRKHNGFTLIEIMVVITIIGILVSVAAPAYNKSVDKTRRTDGQATLLQLANTLERYYSEQSPFTYVGATLGAGGIFPDEAPLGGDAKHYDLSFSVPVTATTYILLATPKNGQAGDGIMTLNQAAQRGWDSDHSGVIDADEGCWVTEC